MPVTYQTERLALRPFVLTDAKRVSDITSNYDVAKMLGKIPSPNPPLAVEGWILINEALRQKGDKYTFAIIHPDAPLIGSVSLTRKGGAWELSYFLDPAVRGQGFAAEAVRGALNWALANLAATSFSAAHHVDNPQSGRVLEKVGFTTTGASEYRFSLARGHRVLCLTYLLELVEPIDLAERTA